MNVDYGIAIAGVTLCVRLLLLPLGIRQRKQMKKQEAVNAQAELIRKKYSSDQERMNRELQKLYQQEGVSLSGCLIPFLQLPVMAGVYHAIRLLAAADAATILLPWISSLLERDRLMILPLATILIQMLPQLYPYMKWFRALKLNKTSPGMAVMLLAVNAAFVFTIPSGVGIYYFVSGLFTAVEQFVENLLEAGKLPQAAN
ncbi:YidC/Oxa1 family membrane protein insertase [Ruminococcus sp. 5_1_39BFAA]|uniref:YidC/Oxa1 family membrane protein insertase n=1 Tax=Ruminococcus sp. 5_1_39BFAA TaxID=457412 RepID=UPI003561858F